jgi:hypothetical protein
VLFVAWRNSGRWWYLIALVALSAVSVGAEALNVARGLDEKAGGAAGDDAAALVLARHVEESRRELVAAAARVDELLGTDRDGNPKNDGALPVAQSSLLRAQAEHDARVNAAVDAARAAALRQSAVHPLVGRRLAVVWVTVALVALRAVAVALAAIVHSDPVAAGEGWQLVAKSLARRRQGKKRE